MVGVAVSGMMTGAGVTMQALSTSKREVIESVLSERENMQGSRGAWEQR